MSCKMENNTIMMYQVISVNSEKQDVYVVELKASDQTLLTLTVHEELVVKYRLVVGKLLSVYELEAIYENLDLGKAYKYAINLLSSRNYTIYDLTQKLLAKQYEGHIVSELIERLKQLNLLNDEVYATQYVVHHANLGKKGPKLLERELHEKKINQELINKALVRYEEELQVENIEKLVAQQIRQNNKYGQFYLKQKIVQALAVKGFRRDLIESALQSVESDDEKEEILIKKELTKLLRRHSKLESFQCKTKVIQALMRKGYSYDLITSFYGEALEELALGVD